MAWVDDTANEGYCALAAARLARGEWHAFDMLDDDAGHAALYPKGAWRGGGGSVFIGNHLASDRCEGLGT